MGVGGAAIAWLAAMAAGQVEGTPSPRPRRSRRGLADAPDSRGWGRWLGEPRAAVLIVLLLIVVVGAGRKLIRAWRARGAVERLGGPDVSAPDVEAAVEFGRDGLMDLFRVLGTADKAEVRDAAGHAVSVLWARDELIAEEEKALVRRGFAVTWHARRRYPRALRSAIPMAVSYSIPFLRDDGRGVAPTSLEWSHAILGAGRAALETPSPWTKGPGRAEFALIPGDFDTDGPHKLVLKTRVRTAGLTTAWELELPQMPLSFEFDPRLAVDSLFTLPDAARGEAIARAVQLVAHSPAEGETEAEARAADFLDLNATLALRDPPLLAVTCPLTCDLAHSIEIEIDGTDGRYAAGHLILAGQGLRTEAPETTRSFALGPIAPIPAELLDHPGRHRLRVQLIADADRGWSDPDIRSIWPGTIVTEWVEVQVVRR